MFCKKCGKQFNPKSIGHVDDHMKICSLCWNKELLKKALSNLGRQLAKEFRLERHTEMLEDY